MQSFLLFTSLGCLGMVPGLAIPAQQNALGAAPQAVVSAHHEHAPAVRSTTLTVRAGEQEAVLSLADLQALPQTSVTVMNAHTKQEETYSGPRVSEVLARAGVTLSPATEHAVLRSYVVATGTDGYFVVFSGAELQGALHKGEFILAIAQAGQPLAGNGAFELIDPLDAKPARWVRNLKSLTVIPVTAPAGDTR